MFCHTLKLLMACTLGVIVCLGIQTVKVRCCWIKYRASGEIRSPLDENKPNLKKNLKIEN